MTDLDRPLLRRLAERCGILDSYRRADTHEIANTEDSTREALLAAMGFDASSEEAAGRALEETDAAETFATDADFDAPGDEDAPLRCFETNEKLGKPRGTGIAVNLYSAVGSEDWGFGDFGVLGELIDESAGADFIAINPLHARNDVDRNPGPYLPSSRLYLDPLYIDITAVPEFSDERSGPLGSAVDEVSQGRIEALRAAGSIDYGEVATVKHDALRLVHDAFLRSADRNSERHREFEAFARREGGALERFAVHRALEKHFASRPEGRDWRRWPSAYRNPASPAVRSFARENSDEIAYQTWLQFEADRQAAAAAARAASAGMAIGLVHDLAIGSAADGADAWAFQEELACGATIGAPPDAFAPMGQEWGVVPMIPFKAARAGFVYWRKMLERALRHAGAVRIDHAMGLVRQFWVPGEGRPLDGAYVRYPAGTLLDILASESRKSRTVVIGEDLGTVPEGFRERMRERGMLRTLVLYFERHDDGSFRGPSEYDPEAIAVANTHDLATLAGYWTGRDLEVRFAAGQIPDEPSLEAERARRDADRRHLDRFLSETTGTTDRSAASLCDAVSRLLAQTPCRLVAVSLDDVAGEIEAINVPGTMPPARANWTRRMARTVRSMSDAGRLANAVAALRNENGAC